MIYRGMAAGAALLAVYLLSAQPPEPLTSASLPEASFETAAGTPAAAPLLPVKSEPLRMDMALAPISLGNPVAAATLNTHTPAMPRDDMTGAVAASGPYAVVVRPQRGDTLGDLFEEAGVPTAEAHAAIAAMSRSFSPRRLQTGQEITLTFAPPKDGAEYGRFLGFSLYPEWDHMVRVWREGDEFKSAKEKRLLTHGLARVEGVIENSLYEAAVEAGVPASVLVEMIRLFSWDVDFQREIQPGDSFELMYEQAFDKTGTLVRNGRILAAAMILSDERRSMYLFETPDGPEYFDQKGRGARKALLRTPIDGAKLTSSFGKRKHPILGYTKMHKGVDFGAATGTPIYAAGEGTVEKAGWEGGYGNYVRLHHTDNYSTVYGHMSRIGKGIAVGRRVRQGEIIGYVGSTGRSTGPHLHYEIMVKNQHVNPMTVKMPSGRKLEGKELTRFMAVKTEHDQRYAALAQETVIASNGKR
ncbi:MAG: M23 family metallopeptidase [Magnetospirillum sp. WYHS-4]